MANKSAAVSSPKEMLIRVDAEDQVIGHATKHACHQEEGLLHRAFSIFIFNSEGQLLIHQRSAQKPLWPLFWTNSCCSHPRQGESLESASKRRLFEELGLETELHFLFRFQYQAQYKNLGSEHELCSVFFGISDKQVRPHPLEIAAWRYIDIHELTQSMKDQPGQFTPWFKLEWLRMWRDHWQTLGWPKPAEPLSFLDQGSNHKEQSIHDQCHPTHL